jgi:hypothetical protein
MQERHLRPLLTPRCSRSLPALDGAGVKGMGFGLKVDLGVDVCSIE